MAEINKIDEELLKKFSAKPIEKGSRDLKVYFLIVCEGEKTEPNYFKSFPKQTEKFIYDLKFEGGGISTLKVVEKAIELRDKSSQKYDRVWAVFDRDSFKAESFNNAIKKAKANNIKCAWSNEAFELWYLLHFHNRVTAMARGEYKNAISKAVNDITDKQGKKKGKVFTYQKNDPDMFSLLKKYGNQQQAMKWAEKLNDNFDGEKFAEFNPSTQVYKLVEELIGKSEEFNKEIKAKHEKGE